METADDSALTNECSTGDSGFADSRQYRKEEPSAPVMPHQNVPAQQTSLDSDAAYVRLIQADVQPPGYYKSAQMRDNVPGINILTVIVIQSLA